MVVGATLVGLGTAAGAIACLLASFRVIERLVDTTCSDCGLVMVGYWPYGLVAAALGSVAGAWAAAGPVGGRYVGAGALLVAGLTAITMVPMLWVTSALSRPLYLAPFLAGASAACLAPRAERWLRSRPHS
jgi:hypothetical protein